MEKKSLIYAYLTMLIVIVVLLFVKFVQRVTEIVP